MDGQIHQCSYNPSLFAARMRLTGIIYYTICKKGVKEDANWVVDLVSAQVDAAAKQAIKRILITLRSNQP